MAERGDHAGAEAEYRDVLAARLRVQGPDHRSTLITRKTRGALDRGRHRPSSSQMPTLIDRTRSHVTGAKRSHHAGGRQLTSDVAPQRRLLCLGVVCLCTCSSCRSDAMQPMREPIGRPTLQVHALEEHERTDSQQCDNYRRQNHDH